MPLFRRSPVPLSPKEHYRQVQEKLNRPGSPFVQTNDRSGGEVWLTTFSPIGEPVMAFSLVLGADGFTLQWNYTLTGEYREELRGVLKEYLGKDAFDRVPQVH